MAKFGNFERELAAVHMVFPAAAAAAAVQSAHIRCLAADIIHYDNALNFSLK